MTFDKTFLEDEVRLGFYIPSAIKQAWAAELEILKVIDDVCSRNSIHYFADWGTFLGAVRHGGFIPWDDDLDLVMLREDYDKFLSIAPDELPDGYSVHTFRNEEGFIEFHADVINCESARFDQEHYNRFHGFPYMCGIDIFVLDFVYPDANKEKQRCKDTTYIIAFADGLLAGDYNSATIAYNLDKIEDICNTKIDRTLSPKELWIKLYELAERKCAEVSKDFSDTLIQLVPWGLKGQTYCRYSINNYNQIIHLPFEHTSVPVPLFYDRLLTQRYGNYMQMIKTGGAHDYPYFDKQKKELENIFGHSINGFAFPGIPSKISLENCWKVTITECLDNLNELCNIIALCDESLRDAICNSQDLAIELGNYIENIKGSNHLSIKFIEEYCEILFKAYSFFFNDNPNAKQIKHNELNHYINDVILGFNNMRSSIEEYVIKRKEVVFLSFKGIYWNSYNDIYQNYINDTDYDVYVIPIPYYFKNYDGTLSDEQFDLSSYPDNIKLTRYDEFSLEFHHPDMIFIQSPYDQYNAVTSIHPNYYSSAITNFTDKLVYVPWFTTDSFTSSDVRHFNNMDYYVCMPGIVYSDSIILDDINLKKTYIEKLTSWAGKETEEYWENKISIASNKKTASAHANMKMILYYLGQGQPLQNIDKFINKFKSNLNVFSSYEKELSVICVIPQELINNLKKYHPDVEITLYEIIDQYKSSSWLTFINNINDSIVYSCDSYYGDTSPIGTVYSFNNKPVMIQNYEV